MYLRGAGLRDCLAFLQSISLSLDNGFLLLTQDVFFCCSDLKCLFLSKVKVKVM